MIYNGFDGGPRLQEALCLKRRDQLLQEEPSTCCRQHKGLFFYCHSEDLYQEITCTCGTLIESYPYTYTGIWEEIFGAPE